MHYFTVGKGQHKRTIAVASYILGNAFDVFPVRLFSTTRKSGNIWPVRKNPTFTLYAWNNLSNVLKITTFKCRTVKSKESRSDGINIMFSSLSYEIGIARAFIFAVVAFFNFAVLVFFFDDDEHRNRKHRVNYCTPDNVLACEYLARRIYHTCPLAVGRI